MRGMEQGVGGRQGGLVLWGEMELPRLLSLVQAVPVKVCLCIEVVVGGHLLVQTKVLHPHCLQNISHQQSLQKFKQSPSIFSLASFFLIKLQNNLCPNFGAGHKKQNWGEGEGRGGLDLPLYERSRGKTRLLAVIEEPPVRVVLCRNGISTGLCFLAPLESLACPIIIGDLLVWGTLLFTGRVRANGGDREV